MSEIKVIEAPSEELVEETLDELEFCARIYGLEIDDAALALVADIVKSAVESGLDQRLLKLAMRSAANSMEEPNEERAQRNARIALNKALRRDAYQEEAVQDDAEASRQKGATVAEAARKVARLCLDDGQRVALGELLRLGTKLRDSAVAPMQLDVVWLFETAFGACAKGYAWVADAKLDLAAELLDELGRGGDRAPCVA